MNIPSIIYIAGKTCTGKTTLSKQLSDKYQYPIIELDTIVDVLGDEKDHLYIEAYQGDINSPVVRRFIDLTVKKLSEAIRNYHGVIFEGAIANPDILMDILKQWQLYYKFIYLHPTDINNYNKQILSRFIKTNATNRNGLPSKFWNKFTKPQLTKYFNDRIITNDIQKNTNLYAEDSMKESSRRLEKFSLYFNDIDVREI